MKLPTTLACHNTPLYWYSPPFFSHSWKGVRKSRATTSVLLLLSTSTCEEANYAVIAVLLLFTTSLVEHPERKLAFHLHVPRSRKFAKRRPEKFMLQGYG